MKISTKNGAARGPRERRAAERAARRGMISLDYVLVLGVTFPLSVLLLRLLERGLIALYYFTSVTLGWLM